MRMNLGNRPKEATNAIVGKRYWWLCVGSNAQPHRRFDHGWTPFEFVITKRYKALPRGEAHPYAFRLAFAYWLPIFPL